MRNIRVFLDQPLSSGSELELTDEPAHYLRNVLRLGSGSSVTVFNGDGTDYDAVITESSKRLFRMRIGDRAVAIPPPLLPISIGIGVSRGERMDFVIQKATELGVSAITPLLLSRCNAKLDIGRRENRLRHWNQVMISACEQSGRGTLVEINTPVSLQDWLSSQQQSLKLVLHPWNAESLSAPSTRPESVSLLAGPEGGLTEEELAQAMAGGFQTWQLGERVLRTETAPLAALSVIQFLWGDLGPRGG